MDNKTIEQRKANMSRIRSKNTKPEELVRKYLFSRGFRYRKNDRRYPGKPDVVLPKYRVLIFVHGCFWHQHHGCKYAVLPKSNADYWIPKLEKNVQRDRKTVEECIALGWRVILIWECALKGKLREISLETLIQYIVSPEHDLKYLEITSMGDVYGHQQFI